MIVPFLVFGVLALSAAGAVADSAGGAPDPETAVWVELKRSLFGERPVATGAGVVALAAPARADDGAVVPIAIRPGFAQSAARFIRRIYLIVDNNPLPLAATVEFTPDSGRADLETRIRIEQYSYVRAVAELSDGTLAADARFVKASGGCSAPAGRDAAAVPVGRMRLSADAAGAYREPVRAQLLVRHPNDTGLVMDQITRLYAPAYYVRSLHVSYAGRKVLSAEVNFSISEDPYFRFYFMPAQDGELKARVVDTTGASFETTLAVRRSASRVPGL